MRFQDRKLLDSYKGRTRCEWCNHSFPAGWIVAHHLISRGAGGSDIPENLIAVDPGCHGYLQNHIPQSVQMAMQAHLLRTTAPKLEDFLRAVQRLDKSATADDVQRLRLEILGRAA